MPIFAGNASLNGKCMF